MLKMRKLVSKPFHISRPRAEGDCGGYRGFPSGCAAVVQPDKEECALVGGEKENICSLISGISNVFTVDDFTLGF